jgi:hypothetical protein
MPETRRLIDQSTHEVLRLLEFDDRTAQQPDEEPDKLYNSQQLPTL